MIANVEIHTGQDTVISISPELAGLFDLTIENNKIIAPYLRDEDARWIIDWGERFLREPYEKTTGENRYDISAWGDQAVAELHISNFVKYTNILNSCNLLKFSALMHACVKVRALWILNNIHNLSAPPGYANSATFLAEYETSRVGLVEYFHKESATL